MTSIRITDTEEECYRVAAQLEKIFKVKDVSKFYKNRGSKLGRVYVEL